METSTQDSDFLGPASSSLLWLCTNAEGQGHSLIRWICRQLGPRLNSSAALSFAAAVGAQPGRAHEDDECKKESREVGGKPRDCPSVLANLSLSRRWLLPSGIPTPKNLSKGVAFTLLKDLRGSAPGGDSDLFLPHPEPCPTTAVGLTWDWLQVLPLSKGRKISGSQEDPPRSLPKGRTPPLPPRLPCFVQRAHKLSHRERSWAPCPAPGLQDHSQPVPAISSPSTNYPFMPMGTMAVEKKDRGHPSPFNL